MVFLEFSVDNESFTTTFFYHQVNRCKVFYNHIIGMD